MGCGIVGGGGGRVRRIFNTLFSHCCFKSSENFGWIGLRIGKIGDGKMRLTVIVNVKKSVIATVNRKRKAVVMDRMTLILNMEMIVIANM